MYAAGNLPDHVTRYNHKNQSRWMVMAEPPSRRSFWDVVEKVTMLLCFTGIGAGLVTTAVFIMQAV